MKTHLPWLLGILVAVSAYAQPAEDSRSRVTDSQLNEQIRHLKSQSADSEKLRRAQDWMPSRYLSSLQVKAMAAAFADEGARLEFAQAAFSRTVDPENFYEVYDAFSSFSKVFRLHDFVKRFQAASHSPLALLPQALTDEEFTAVKAAIRKENFDDRKKSLARQIISGRPRFSSRQVKEILALFDFDAARLDVAKFAYDYTIDRENFFQVYDAFEFSSNKDNLTNYLESKGRRKRD
jgi:hypothetical protein